MASHGVIRLLRPWIIETVIVGFGVMLMFSGPQLIRAVGQRVEEVTLYEFAATGVISDFRPARDGRFVLRIEDQLSHVTYSVTCRAFSLGPDVLTRGARFSKEAYTDHCIVDGIQHRLY